MRTTRRLRSGVILVGLLTLALPAPVAAIVVQTTSTTMSTEPPSTFKYGEFFLWHATVTPDGAAEDASLPYGTVTWYRYTTAPAFVAISDPATLVSGQTEITPTGMTVLDPGDYTLFAQFHSTNPYFSDSQSADYPLTVGPADSATTLTGPTTVEAHDDINLNGSVVSQWSENGTLNYYEVGNPTPICSHAVSTLGSTFCVISRDVVGTYSFYAAWTPDDDTNVTGSTSDNLVVQVVADVAHAHDVGLDLATFYPVTDGYRDKVKISGFRDEPLSVVAKVYSPGGSLLKTLSATSNVNTYALYWDGRNSAGSVLPEGKYKVVQTLTDAHSNKKVVTSFVTLSKKRLIWHSSSITKKGSAISSYGTAGGGSVAVNTTAGSIRLRAPHIYYDAAGAGWQFALPTAVSYRSIAVQVYASHVLTVGGEVHLGAQNFADCAYSSSGTWYESCFDQWKLVGNSFGAKAWYSTKVLTSTHRFGRTVRSLVVAYAGTTYIYKARVTFQYATLGY